MEVAIANSTTTTRAAGGSKEHGPGQGVSGLRSPFQREVREWQRLDPATGALLTGRLEADRWVHGPSNSYGKISDSQNIAQPDGTQLSQRKQLEVLQARTAAGAVQVIRAQTVQTTSSRWSSSATSSPVGHLGRHSSNGSPFANGFHCSDSEPLLNGRHRHRRPAPTADVSAVDSDGDIDDLADSDGDGDDDRRLSNTNSNTNGHSFSGFLLLDTAPSLKLSNLMKSSSSVSSSSSSSTATGAAGHSNNSRRPHSSGGGGGGGRGGGSVSLHSIVGNADVAPAAAAAAPAASLSTATSSSATATWRTQQQQQRSSRLFEPLPTFGKDNSGHGGSSSKPRVGGAGRGFAVGNAANDDDYDYDDDDGGFGDAGGARAAAVVVADERCSLHLTPTQLHRQPRRDLESFRHYSDHPTGSSHNHNHSNNLGDDDEDAGDDLRLSARHQRRQQIPAAPSSSTSASLLQLRGRSVSTDDLSTEWDPRGEDAAQDEPGEWRRVSKLRRSFQSGATRSAAEPRRPLDLPESSVSVSRIRAELENGRRLTTAMRNNHVDLAALQTILDPAPGSPGVADDGRKPAPARRTTFLTAESLKEIRGRLKKLSDESLYKEDFVVLQQPPQDDQIEVRHARSPRSPRPLPQLRQLTPEPSPEGGRRSPTTAAARSAFRVVGPQLARFPATPPAAKHTTNSLESRQRGRDTSSAEWHLRRKSYGFEKMSPPDDPAAPLSRTDASTDSGLGRSGELASWSPTEPAPVPVPAPASRGTVIHFGSGSDRRHKGSDLDDSGDELRRPGQSAGEGGPFGGRKTSQVRLNGLHDADSDSPPNAGLATVSSTTTTTTAQLLQRTQQKRVEFCKTEVHFAAESGRVNIVETDGKPPPTNNFRRRRRTASGPLQSLVKGAAASATTSSSAPSSVALPVTRFGDDQHRPRTVATHTVAYRASLVEADQLVEPSSVTVSLPQVREPLLGPPADGWRGSCTSTSGVESTDGEADEAAAIRGILKNKPVKPRPYHLGENFDSADALWGVQLKPVGAGPGSPSQARRPSFNTAAKADSPPSKSVAERVRIVEKRQDSATSNGYSTKINLNLCEAAPDWTPPGAVVRQRQRQESPGGRRPSAQALLLQDLREHQRELDEGLKSTSLIIRTMRSASEFDEAMRRLSLASLEAGSMAVPPIVVPTPMLRSSSCHEPPQRRASTASTSSASFTYVGGGVVKSASYSSSSSLSTATSTEASGRRFSAESFGSTSVAPLAAPRLRLIGNTEIPVSQQLAQLRRLYEAAAASGADADPDEPDDSADEEVKRYFPAHQEEPGVSGGGTGRGTGTGPDSSSLEDERAAPVEYSSSWSRLKAKRTVWRIEAEDHEAPRPEGASFERRELPKSNVMNIELHSPQATLEKPASAPAAAKTSPGPPVAKPRTTVPGSDSAKAPLKIIREARGARRLREHELSFFGVQVGDAKAQQATAPGGPSATKRTLPHRQRVVVGGARTDQGAGEPRTHPHAATTTTSGTTTKWNLLNDKPDLLRHSPVLVEPQVVVRTAQLGGPERRAEEQAKKRGFSPVQRVPDSDDEADWARDEGHFYENITNEISSVIKVVPPAASYDRKADLERDARILSEMTLNADQTMKAISDEAALKDQRRRSLSRRNSKPLETIDEKAVGERISDTCIAVKVSRSGGAATTVASRARSSSQSSVESCPRARSRSLSSEREYENVKAKPARASAASAKAKTKPKHSKAAPTSRSSSRESQRSTHTGPGSSEDELGRREGRSLRAKTKRVAASSASQTRSHSRSQRAALSATTATTTSSSSSSQHKEKSKSGSTTRSSQRERAECPTTDHGSSRRHKSDLHDAPKRAASDRRTAAASSAEKQDTSRSGVRLVRSSRSSHHEHESSQRSSNRSERSGTEQEREKEKEKVSRSKGHSRRSPTRHISEAHHQHQRHSHSIEAAPQTSIKGRVTSSAEHRKTSTSASAARESHSTHSKNAPFLNGFSSAHQHHGHHQQQPPDHHQHHVHHMTTTTIAAKHRERHGKDRK